METPLLKDPDVQVSPQVLQDELGDLYPVYEEFIECIESERFMLTPEWRYYKDGKAWLCKITRKKKTVAWMSLWVHCFQVALYFTEKNGAGIPGLDISDSLKLAYRDHRMVGKIKPMIAEVSKKSHLDDIYTLLGYKLGIK